MREPVDLRTPMEIVLEARSHEPLDPADEAIARRLAALVMRTDDEYTTDMAAYERTAAEIKQIGNDLCRPAPGMSGDTHMKLVAGRVSVLGGRIRTLEMLWNGICGWRY